MALCSMGCASLRQSIGRPIANTGEHIGKFGAVVLIASASTIILIPAGIGIGLPIILAGVPLYYGGSWLAGDKPGEYPSP